jgi:hypothetical protein
VLVDPPRRPSGAGRRAARPPGRARSARRPLPREGPRAPLLLGEGRGGGARGRAPAARLRGRRARGRPPVRPRLGLRRPARGRGPALREPLERPRAGVLRRRPRGGPDHAALALALVERGARGGPRDRTSHAGRWRSTPPTRWRTSCSASP